MRHRAAELGERCRYARVDRYRDALGEVDGPLQVLQPTSRAAVAFVRAARRGAGGRATAGPRLRDHPRGLHARGPSPAAGSRLLHGGLLPRRAAPPRRAHGRRRAGRRPLEPRRREPRAASAAARRRLGVPEPSWPGEDDIDAEVRDDLDRWERDGDVAFIGADGPRRFAATRDEALAALDDFVTNRLPRFGPHEDAVMTGDPWMAHSLLSAPMNLGLLDPLEVRRGGRAAPTGAGTCRSSPPRGSSGRSWAGATTSGTSTGTLGEDYRHANRLGAPAAPAGLVARPRRRRDRRRAAFAHTLNEVRDHGWVHHIPRLMVLGNYAAQRGWRPDELTDWFHRAFVDGYDWVMVPNVVGMSQHADAGVMATKPYVSGGAYLNRMTDHCGGCRLDPGTRVGENAVPVHRRLLVVPGPQPRAPGGQPRG